MRIRVHEPVLGFGCTKVRITRPAPEHEAGGATGEGIVQPISKEMEQLSRRLHQRPSGRNGQRGSLDHGREVRSMRRYKEVSSLSPVDAAYIAGLVDGEGTITLSRKHAGDERQLVVSISNTEDALLEYVLHTVAAGKITRKRTMKPHHSPGLTYAIWNRQALRLLFQIESFLRSYKRLRARLV